MIININKNKTRKILNFNVFIQNVSFVDEDGDSNDCSEYFTGFDKEQLGEIIKKELSSLILQDQRGIFNSSFFNKKTIDSYDNQDNLFPKNRNSNSDFTRSASIESVNHSAGENNIERLTINLDIYNKNMNKTSILSAFNDSVGSHLANSIYHNGFFNPAGSNNDG